MKLHSVLVNENFDDEIDVDSMTIDDRVAYYTRRISALSAHSGKHERYRKELKDLQNIYPNQIKDQVGINVPYGWFERKWIDLRGYAHRIFLHESLPDEAIKEAGRLITAINRSAKEKAQLETLLRKLQEERNTAYMKGQEVADLNIDPASIPEKIEFFGRRFKNAYYAGTRARFAGAPEKFPIFTRDQKQALFQLQTALERNGIPKLQMLYGAKDDAGNTVNFIAFNPDMTVVWRKYDRGGGSAQNLLYIKGADPIYASWFMRYPPAKQDTVLEPAKQP